MAVGLLIWFISVVLSISVAQSKGRSGCGWFLLSFLFGPIALILVMLLPSKD